MLRSSSVFTWLCIAPLAVSQAQVGGSPCRPCAGTGGCKATEPILSSSDHFCQNHAGHDHSGLNVTDVDMGKVNLFDGSLQGSTFTDSSFFGANLGSVDCSDAAWIDGFADRVFLGEADCTNMDFTGTRLRDGILIGTDLTGAMMPTDFYGTDFTGSDLTAAVLSSGPDMADFSDADFTDVVGLGNTIGQATYNVNTSFAGTGFDPVAAGWILGTEELLFQDTFESGDFTTGGWVAKNAKASVGYQARFEGGFGARAKRKTWFEKPLSTVGYKEIRVQYWRKTKGYDAGEFLRVQWWDGAAWNTLEETTDKEWAQPEFLLPAGANNNPSFKLRFKSKGNRRLERGDVDNVEIFGTPL